MLFDDRLATVLRAPAEGGAAARTQFRQLLDLLGTAPGEASDRLTAAAYTRLDELAAMIPADEQSRILREPGLRLRNRQLLAALADGEPKPAAAALATARLGEADWLELVPELPIIARGFLRHRRDLPESVRALLDRLGVRDFVLPQPEGLQQQRHSPEREPDPATAGGTPPAGDGEDEGIRGLLRRIEAFRQERRDAPSSPQVPSGDGPQSGSQDLPDRFDFVSDAHGRISWASTEFAPFAVGMQLMHEAPGVTAAIDGRTSLLMRRHQPLRGAPLRIDAMEAISGEWRIDAEPVFARPSGAFEGYRGRIRRPVRPSAEDRHDTVADRMRQALHELRTPVNAIQGFAEIIQQQLFGPAPNEYRALAAAVTVDAARLLAAFEEIDRLARLESGALELTSGEADMRAVLGETVRRLEAALASRNAGFTLTISGEIFAVGIDRVEAMLLAWRVLATFAGQMASGERLALALESKAGRVSIEVPLPASLAQQEDVFVVRPPETRPVISAGTFGSGFSLRLARAEAASAGGQLDIVGERLVMALPLLSAVEDALGAAGGTG